MLVHTDYHINKFLIDFGELINQALLMQMNSWSLGHNRWRLDCVWFVVSMPMKQAILLRPYEAVLYRFWSSALSSPVLSPLTGNCSSRSHTPDFSTFASRNYFNWRCKKKSRTFLMERISSGIELYDPVVRLPQELGTKIFKTEWKKSGESKKIRLQ